MGSQAKFFVRKEPGPEDDCPLWVGLSWGASSGLWMGDGKVGGQLQLGLDITRGQDSKPGLRETAPWLPESNQGAG